MKTLLTSSRRMIRVLVLGMLLGLLASPQAKAQNSAVPLIQLSTGHIAVNVRVNGQGPFLLIFDTGSPVTFISNRAAKQAGLSTGESSIGMMGLDGQLTVKTFGVGGALVKEMRILIMDHPVVSMLSKFEGKPVDGIVGMSFFSRFRTSIDYKAKTITLIPSKYQPKDVMQSITQRLLSGNTGKVVLASQGLWGFQAVTEGTDAGVLVKQVYAGSAADAAGLRVGDRVLAIDSRWTDTPNDLFDAASRLPVGRDAVLEILRDGKKQSLTLRPRVGI
jgi:hypothetical protein